MVSPFRPTERTLAAWTHVLDESESILDGRKLLPFWRGEAKDRGFNVKKFLTEPKDFDFILFIHGTGALSYVERGDVTSVERWGQFQDAFGGDLFSFAIWFN